MFFKFALVSIIAFMLSGCEQLAVMSTPKKKPIASHSDLATQAENKFWDTLHQGRYEDIQKVEYLLTAAYLQNPNDPTLAAHLGFLHIWKITERHREEPIVPTITNEIILSRKYFSDAVELNSDDARYIGFLGDSKLMEGKIFHDEREQTRGYFTLKKAIKAWPEFNYFTAGYAMSSLPADSKQFKEALKWQWLTIDLCAGKKVDRSNPDFAPYMNREIKTGKQRACWNSWIAPYNFEGFWMNMGDMLVKVGEWQTAIKIYQNAKLDKNYLSWPYRQELENKIKHAQENVIHFQKEFAGPDKTMMFNSRYGCMACHQQKNG